MIAVRFYRPRTLWSRLIAWCGRLHFYHADIAWMDGFTQCAAESAPGGVHRWVEWTGYSNGAAAVLIVPVDPLAAARWIAARLGEPYGYLDDAELVARAWTGVPIGGNPRGMECAEMVAELLRALWPAFAARVERTNLSPDDLAAVLRSLAVPPPPRGPSGISR